MVSISIDLAQLLGEIRQIVIAVRDESNAAKERLKDAQILVYKALAVHPALEYMHSPTDSLGDMDWYTELRSQWSSGIFQKLGQYQHFKRTTLLGDAGSRTRIMLLFLWILGNRLAEDQVDRMISVAVGDGLRAAVVHPAASGSIDSLSWSGLIAEEQELLQLDSVKDVLIDLRRMIKTKLSLPADRNPFLSRDFCVEDEDESLPRSELWGYQLPEDQQYELDIKRNPTGLLRSLSGKVIIPQTKLTLLLINWATCNFGLGKKAHSRDEVDPDAFWNADPPSGGITSYEIPQSVNGWITRLDAPDLAPYAPLEELPVDDWIHIRFCEVYDIHEWVHDSFTRILVFSAFCGALSAQKWHFPSQHDIRSTRGIVKWFRRRMPEEICKFIQSFVLHSAVALWNANDQYGNWHLEQWSAEERGLAVIFTDSFMYAREKDVDGLPFFVMVSESWFIMQDFFRDPARFCPDAPDILSLPLLHETAHTSNLDPAPKFRDDICICGQCHPIFEQMLSRLEWFRTNYFTIIDRAVCERACKALRVSWEPTLHAAEQWFENILYRIESPYPLFPMLTSLPRLGPIVLEVTDRMGVKVESHLTPQSLLRFTLTLYTVTSDFAIAYYPPLPMNALGLLIALPLIEDREDYLPADQELEYAVEYVLFAIGDWLYELSGSDGLTLIYSDDNFTIKHSLDMLKWRTVCMPDCKPDFPGRFPSRHLEQAKRIPVTIGDEVEVEFRDKVEIVLSDRESDGFPLLSLSSEASESAGRTFGDVAALLRVHSLGRTIESVWRPKVRMGQSCDHTHNHQVMLFCSTPTCLELLNLMEPSANCDITASVPITWNTRVMHGPVSTRKAFEPEWRDVLSRRMSEYAERAAPVTRRGGYLELNRVCIVRCGVREGPINVIVVLAASLRKHVYVIHRNECWDCALLRMDELECTVGIALYTKYVTHCDECQAQ